MINRKLFKSFIHQCHQSSSPTNRKSCRKNTRRSILHATTFYGKPLPSKLVAFSSNQGKEIFKEALQQGHMESFFTLSENLQIQSQPAYCGLGTLTMVLNSLQIDPGRNWKGVWRWFSEEMFDCCTSLSHIQKNGLTLDQFWCLSKCNGADSTLIRPSASSIDEFRSLINHATSQNKYFVVANFDRKVLDQTGDGHFSVVAGYNAHLDLVLLMETARFKYPSYWVPVTDLWRAMCTIDSTSHESRGYLIVRVPEGPSSILYTIFLNHKTSWRQLALTLSVQTLPNIMLVNAANNLEELVVLLLKYLPPETYQVLLEYSRTVILECTTCVHTHRTDTVKLLNEIQKLELYRSVVSAMKKVYPLANRVNTQYDESNCAVNFDSIENAPRIHEIITLLLMTCPIDCLVGIVPANIMDEWLIKRAVDDSIDPSLRLEILTMRKLIDTMCSEGLSQAKALGLCSNNSCSKRTCRGATKDSVPLI